MPLKFASMNDSPELVSLGGAENLNNVFFTNHYSSQNTDPSAGTLSGGNSRCGQWEGH
ncbi:MAG: hypothetical protein PHT78_01435 [Desulfitobacteriaceae bacterium]|nr:hypothetical protein [Desulfitobacteriaceae bacterium]MDD4751901.1 hypothetical protein [Desulfitobacteriaceae bacterium]